MTLGKMWLEPELSVAYMHGFKANQKKEVKKIIEKNKETIKSEWEKYFNK